MAIHSISFFIFFSITVKNWRQIRSTVKLSFLDKFPVDGTSAPSIRHFISVSEYNTILILLLLWDKNGNDVIFKCPDVHAQVLVFFFESCRIDLLRELEKVELQISTGVLLENYMRLKSVYGFRRDAVTPRRSFLITSAMFWNIYLPPNKTTRRW